jgi:hypothetical protein
MISTHIPKIEIDIAVTNTYVRKNIHWKDSKQYRLCQYKIDVCVANIQADIHVPSSRIDIDIVSSEVDIDVIN